MRLLLIFILLLGTASAERWVRQGRGPSMLPVLPESCYIEIHVGGADIVREGVVIYFIGRNGNRVAHAVAAITPEGHFVTRGYNNPCDDDLPVTPERYIGRVTRWATMAAPDDLLPLERPAARLPRLDHNAEFICTP